MRITFIAIWALICLLACGPIGGTSADASAGAGGAPQASPLSGLTGSAGARPANPHNRQSLVWVWENYRTSLNTILENANSFTHVSPALYQMNYSYQSGVVQNEIANGHYDGLTGADMATALHSAGLKIIPLMYAGAGNNGTDLGIQNVLTNKAIAQSFIDSQVQEALDKGYDGWNLDWEVGDGTKYDPYGASLITFLAAFKQALNAHGMVLSFDLGGWYVKQCKDSGGGGLVDLKAFEPAVDQAIIEDYADSLMGPIGQCPGTLPDLQDCRTFGGGLSVMCATGSATSIGLITPSSNPFAPQALDAIAGYGFSSVALWPDPTGFLNSTGVPNNATWFSVLGAWLAQ
jgi:hypothetical protein